MLPIPKSSCIYMTFTALDTVAKNRKQLKKTLTGLEKVWPPNSEFTICNNMDPYWGLCAQEQDRSLPHPLAMCNQRRLILLNALLLEYLQELFG